MILLLTYVLLVQAVAVRAEQVALDAFLATFSFLEHVAFIRKAKALAINNVDLFAAQDFLRSQT